MSEEVNDEEVNPEIMDRLQRILENSNDQFTDHYKFVLPRFLAKKIISSYLIREDLVFINAALKDLTRLLIIRESPFTGESFKLTFETIKTSLWYSIIAFYGKCFTDASKAGHSKLEPNFCFKDNPELLVTHDKLMRLRHQYVAHRGETEFEQAIPMLLIYKGDNPDVPHMRGQVFSSKQTSPDGSDLLAYSDLFEFLIKYVETKLEKQTEKAKDEFWALDEKFRHAFFYR